MSGGVETAEGHPTVGSLADLLRRRVARSPDATAFVWLENGEREGGRLSFAELDRRARAIAWALLAPGFSGKPVLLAYPPGLDLVAALFGCFYAGAVPAVTPPPAGPGLHRLRALAIDSGAAAMLTVTTLAAKVAGEAPDGVAVLATDGLPDVGEFALPSSDPDSLAMLQYTSGSTAAPRGVMLTHANVLANLRAIAVFFGVREGETAVSWLPFHHDLGLFAFVLFPVHAGLTCVLMPPIAFVKRPSRWPEAIHRHHAVLSAGPSFAFDLCARRTTEEQRSGLDLSSWRLAACGAEMIRPDVLERFAETFADAGFAPTALAPGYGLAENTLMASFVRPGEGFSIRSMDAAALANGWATPPTAAGRERRLVCCGRPWLEHELIVVDPVRRTVASDGEIGEIWLRGPSVSQGYWRRPSETAEIFDAKLEGGDPSPGWLRTGDLGFLSADGVTVTGRRKDMIIVRGSNFDPIDLEIAAQTSDPALAPGGGAAFSFEDGAAEQVVLAYEVERSAMKALDAAAVVARVAETMSRDFGLTLYDLVLLRAGALPRTTSGKVQRSLCRDRYAAGALLRLADPPSPQLARWRPTRE